MRYKRTKNIIKVVLSKVRVVETNCGTTTISNIYDRSTSVFEEVLKIDIVSSKRDFGGTRGLLTGVQLLLTRLKECIGLRRRLVLYV